MSKPISYDDALEDCLNVMRSEGDLQSAADFRIDNGLLLVDVHADGMRRIAEDHRPQVTGDVLERFRLEKDARITLERQRVGRTGHRNSTPPELIHINRAAGPDLVQRQY